MSKRVACKCLPLQARDEQLSTSPKGRCMGEKDSLQCHPHPTPAVNQTPGHTLGGVPERLNGPVLKTGVALVVTVGSNPTPTA